MANARLAIRRKPQRPVADDGPIEGHLQALRTKPFVEAAIVTAAERIEEAGPALRTVLARAAAGGTLSDEEDLLFIRGIHILAAGRDTASFPLLLRLVRRPRADLDRLLGDILTESMSRVLASTFDGDVDSLFDAIADPSADEFAREACIGAATTLALHGRIDHERMRGFLERFYSDRPAADDDAVWVGWVVAIALLGFRDLVPLVDRAWAEERIPTFVLGREDFDDAIAAAERAPDDLGRLKDWNLGYVDDVLGELDWMGRLDDRAARDSGSAWSRLLQPSETVTNPWRGVGRNDPCPCGSGKKFKKCCMPV
jgi:hypothetical protein